MPRTIGLVAILACAVVAAMAGAVPPPPPPPPIVTAVLPPPAGVPGAAAVAVQQRVSFSIADAAPAEEGKPLTFRITRTGDDGRAHEVHVSVGPENLVAEREKTVRFEPGDPAQKDVPFQTAPGLPGDGPHVVQALLDRVEETASIGVPRAASGTINDVPLPPPPPKPVTYSITSNGPASRGTELHFTVTRSAPLGPAQLSYRVDREGFMAETGFPLSVDFPEGEASVPLVVPSGEYSVCDGSVSVTLDDGAGTQAAAEFSDPPPGPPTCGTRTNWWDIFIEWLGPNAALVIGGVCFVGGIIAHHLLPKPSADRRPPVEDPADGERLSETQADVEPSLEIKPGTASFRPLEEPVSRWPKFSADVTIEPGDLYVTQPLPRLEPDDG